MYISNGSGFVPWSGVPYWFFSVMNLVVVVVVVVKSGAASPLQNASTWKTLSMGRLFRP